PRDASCGRIAPGFTGILCGCYLDVNEHWEYRFSMPTTLIGCSCRDCISGVHQLGASIAFDEAVAEALIFTLEDASNRLRDQGPERRDAAEAGLVDFSGGYARLFRQACAAEAEDRGLLAGRLSELSDQVREAKLRAAEEKMRL